MTKPILLTVNRVGFLGGVERIIINSCVAAVEAGFRPVIACPSGGELARTAQAAGIEVVGLRLDRGQATTSPLQLYRLAGSVYRGRGEVLALARELHASLIHVHHPMSAIQAGSAAHAVGLPVLLHAHETLPIGALYRLAMRKIRHLPQLCLGVSKASCDMLCDAGMPPDRVRLLYNAVDARFFEAVVPADDFADAGLASGPHIGLFGVLEPRKGHEGFLAAARQVLARHPAATFWIVGGQSFADNAAYVANLHRLAEAEGLAGHVRFTGFRADVPNLMAGMDAVVLASTGFESLPTVLIEAGALGRAVVATDIGGVREIVADGRTGLVVPARDDAGLAAAIMRALSPEGAVMAAAARVNARRRFGPARFAHELVEHYETLLKQTVMKRAA